MSVVDVVVVVNEKAFEAPKWAWRCPLLGLNRKKPIRLKRIFQFLVVVLKIK